MKILTYTCAYLIDGKHDEDCPSLMKMPNCPKCGSDRVILPWPKTNDRYECMSCDHRFRPTPRAGGIAVGSDKPALSVSDNSTVTEAGSPALR